MLAVIALALALSAVPQDRSAGDGDPAMTLAVPGDPALRWGAREDEAVSGPHGWSRGDVALEMLFALSMFADWNQTRYTIAAQREVPGAAGRRYYELNPILGPSPSPTNVDLYFLGMTAAHLSVAHLLPRGRWRTAWQLLALGVEVAAVGRNMQMGVAFRF